MTARAASALETDVVGVDNRVVARLLRCALVAVLLAPVAAGCGGPGGDKAGGDRGEPAVLTLESQDDPQLTPAPEFAEAAERLSGGSVRIQVVAAGRNEQRDAERGVVEDVRQGKADLGIVGVPRRDAAAIAGHHTADFRDGRFRFVGDPGSGRSAEGSYVLDGDIVRLTFQTGVALQHGRAYELRWSVYRDSLTFRRAPGSEPLQAFLTAPYRRIR
jgi:hypothetical protein